MPSSSTLVAFVLIAVPGPNLIYLVARSVSEGRRAGLLSALGIETGTLVHTTAAAVRSLASHEVGYQAPATRHRDTAYGAAA